MNLSASLPLSDAQTAVPKRARLGYIDTIRVVLIVLVVMVHASVTYGSIGGWFYVEPGSDDLTRGLLSIFVTLCQSFFMGLFFFISGYFIPGSIDRKGLGWFWKDRLLRLGLPFLVFSFVLAKYPIYVYYTRNLGYNGSLWEFATGNFFTQLDAGPTWFLFALLVLAGVYSLYRLARGKAAPLGSGLDAPTRAALIGFALVMSAGMLLTAQISPIGDFKPLFGFIYLQPAFFPQYLLMFAAGILAYRNDWLNRLDGNQARFWKWLAAGCALALPVLFFAGGAASGQYEALITGFGWPCIALNLWADLTCVSFSLALILGLRERNSTAGPLGKAMQSSAFAAFLIHPVVLVAITTGLSGLAVYALVKFALASVLAVAGSFAIGWLLRQIPGVKSVL